MRQTLSFVHAASAMPKSSDLDVTQPEGYSSVQVGEDAYFARTDSIGVADGVGGWSEVAGANPALYSLKLMHYVQQQLEDMDDIINCDYDINDYYNVSPKSVLQKSYDMTMEDAKTEGLVGSSTAIIAILRDDELRVANIGDCGVMVIRGQEIIFRSEEQQYSFNFPYQLGTGARCLPKKDAQEYSVKVREGDIVILGSDGLFDNVFDDSILEVVCKTIESAPKGRAATARSMSVQPKLISDSLLGMAREVAEDPRATSSPFQIRAMEEGLYYQGGKLDDCTVVVAVIR
ncbi:hypothetical protein HDV05_001640 [Chytridiales sp. JEL 0842]|nr:hypothetical protein HDV05_001640 [Chytridiales sp. JEL 0842]